MRDGGRDAAADEAREGQRDVETEEEDEDVFCGVYCGVVQQCSASERDVDLWRRVPSCSISSSDRTDVGLYP